MSTATKAELEAAAEIVYSALTKVSSRPSRSATRAALPTSGFSKRSARVAKRAASKFIRQTFFIGLEQEVGQRGYPGQGVSQGRHLFPNWVKTGGLRCVGRTTAF